jgi:Na+/phosphate symporter
MLVLLLALVVGLNVAATIRAMRSDAHTAQQKAWQIAIVWALPLLGSIIVLMVLRSLQAEPQKPSAPPIGEAWSLTGMDSVGSNHSHSDSGGHGHS